MPNILKTFCFLIFALATSGIWINPAQAQAYNDDNYYGYNNRQVNVAFDARDESRIRDYYNDYDRRYCGRNSGRKDPVCTESSRRKFKTGNTLPANVRAFYLPEELERRLSRLPSEYEYVRVDRSVLIVSRRTNRIADVMEIKSSSRVTLHPINNSYVVYFDPDTATLARGETRILDQIAREVKATDPRQITVTSYADTFLNRNRMTDAREDALYAMLQAFGLSPRQGTGGLSGSLGDLAHRQEHAVADALSRRGVSVQTLDSATRGPLESELVPDDNWGIEEAQIVVIDLRD